MVTWGIESRAVGRGRRARAAARGCRRRRSGSPWPTPWPTWGCSPGARSPARTSTWRSSARAPTAGCPTCARRPASCGAGGSRRTSAASSCPGRSAVREAAEREGLHEVFRDAGFEWREAGCSMCLAMNPDRLEGRELCASSSNRNFKGRQGSPTGRTLLMSPAMVAAAAIAGEVIDVRRPAAGGGGVIIDDRRAGPSCCAATTSTPIGSCRRGSCGP